VNTLKLYTAISRFGALNYRAKIMIVAFLGTHVPLLAIVGFYLFRTTSDMAIIWSTLGVALVATLVGTGITLFVLNQLLQPVLLTSKVLRTYRQSRAIEALPTDFTDEAGTLMADASATLNQLEQSLKTLETTDLVTGMLNRRALVNTLSTGLSTGSLGPVVVVQSLPVTRLASTYDQARADGFLHVLARRLADALGRDVPLARIDSATFAAVLPAGAETDALLPDIIARVSHDIALDGLTVAPDLMVGVAMPDTDGGDAEVVLGNAVAAAASNRVPRTFTYYSAAARDAARERFELEQELRQAIRTDAFDLHFQPVVDLGLGRVSGAEALIRWRHPDRGLVAPGLFIPAAERSGLIDDIGRWVIRAACQQVGNWQSQGLPPMKVAVNLSARQFLDGKLVGLLSESIADAGIAADRLEIELTESAAMADYEHTRRTFGQLTDLGVTIAIDDFGTGYASMSYLRKLPFDKLKIDREFVTNIDTMPQNQAICGAMVMLGEGLGLKVLAEGTERAEEVSWLNRAGCNLFQGYYFARPVPADDMAESIEDIAIAVAGLKVLERTEAVARSA
jgi:EAL domain-containing protein (putative c-di-GMP-specific phosphodiesterase class I)/GGDEF domain-containing protein